MVIVVGVASAPWNYLIEYMFEDIIKADGDNRDHVMTARRNGKQVKTSSSTLTEISTSTARLTRRQMSNTHSQALTSVVPGTHNAPPTVDRHFATTKHNNAKPSLSERRAALRKQNIRIAPLTQLNLSKHIAKADCTLESKVLATWQMMEVEAVSELDVNTLLVDISDQYDEINLVRDKLDFCKDWRSVNFLQRTSCYRVTFVFM